MSHVLSVVKFALLQLAGVVVSCWSNTNSTVGLMSSPLVTLGVLRQHKLPVRSLPTQLMKNGNFRTNLVGWILGTALGAGAAWGL